MEAQRRALHEIDRTDWPPVVMHYGVAWDDYFMSQEILMFGKAGLNRDKLKSTSSTQQRNILEVLEKASPTAASTRTRLEAGASGEVPTPKSDASPSRFVFASAPVEVTLSDPPHHRPSLFPTEDGNVGDEDQPPTESRELDADSEYVPSASLFQEPTELNPADAAAAARRKLLMRMSRVPGPVKYTLEASNSAVLLSKLSESVQSVRPLQQSASAVALTSVHASLPKHTADSSQQKRAAGGSKGRGKPLKGRTQLTSALIATVK